MVARAVDVVVYQKQFEEENTRRIAEVLEVDRPGVRFGATGEIEYRFRRLVAWNPDSGAWEFPEEPSVRLRRALELQAVTWPPVEAPATFDDPTEVEP
jgi:hypothetical protein